MRAVSCPLQASTLAWDADLADAARIMASACPSTNPQGQPYLMGYNYLSLTEAVNGWYSKAAAYDFGVAGFQPDAWQFSMMVWRGSTRVGCALQDCPNWSVSVCKFDPPGGRV